MTDISDELELSITIAAPPAIVFRYLSDPARFRAWLGQGAELDPRRGGAVVMQYPNGPTARGTVQELVPDRRLVFSWGYEGSAELPPGASTVSITLEPAAEGTRVVLRHTGLPTRAARESHEAGWRHYLSRLSNSATTEAVEPDARAAVAAYLAAWAEPDAARRAALLEKCWEPEALFADTMGAAAGRDALSAYIAGAQQYAPGARLDLDGSVEVVLERVRFRWRGVMPDGAVIGRGTNFGELGRKGRFVRMTGFWDSG